MGLFDSTPAAQANPNKERFIALLLATGRPGISDLLQWLEDSDFYDAPASANHHGAKEGGLLEHSLAVEEKITPICECFGMDIPMESQRLVALLHDLCKVGVYKIDYRNKKNEETGKWEKVPYYAIEDQFPMQHGPKSVYLAGKFIRLMDEEAMAITFHMGAWHAVEYGEKQSLGRAMGMYPLILALQTADLAATYYDGK